MVFILIISIYLSVGITKLIADIKEPFPNQPFYIRHSSFILKILNMFIWPINLLERRLFKYLLRKLLDNLLILIISFSIIYLLLVIVMS